MQKIIKKTLTGERALFMTHGAEIEDCHFLDGESPLKESGDLKLTNDLFSYKYPLWYGENIVVKDCRFEEMARAGIWYSKHLHFSNCLFEAPKCFRKCHDLTIEDSEFLLAEETLWWNDGIVLKNVKAKHANYLGMGSSNVKADHIEIIGDYLFDGVKNLEIRDSLLECKDAFWNSENVYIENSKIEGEYFGWNSKNMVIKNSTIKSHQGFCYMDGLTMIDCIIEGSDLTFEYCSNLKVSIIGGCLSIKNPISGEIHIGKVEEIITDDKRIDFSKVKIIMEDR